MKNRSLLTLLLAGAAILVVAAVLVFAVVIPARRTETPKQVDWTDTVEEEKKPMPEVNATAPSKKEIEATKAHGKYTATIETDKGTIELMLRGDLAPLTVANFVKLAQSGYYDGLAFHRVEDWVIQGGDPQGTGMGGPGYQIKLEIAKDLSNTRGAVAMARSGDPNSAGSQFYILRTKADWLDGQYAVFGNVVTGLDVVDKMAIGDKMTKITIK